MIIVNQWANPFPLSHASYFGQASNRYFNLLFTAVWVGHQPSISYHVCRLCVDDMNKKGLNLRISERRLNKLRLYAATKEKTMTQLVEDWIDRLPNPEIDKNSTTLSQDSPEGNTADSVNKM